MPFDPNPTAALAFGNANNVADWTQAWEGQWFIGVLDTNNKRVYVLPIDPRTPDALTNAGQRNRNRYASGPESKGLATLFWNSCAANWMDVTGGNTTHHKCLNYYHLAEGDCMGFTLIKLNREGTFAQVKLTSNSLNMKPGDPDLTSRPGHSFSRSTHAHSGALAVDARGLPHNDPHVPGTTVFAPGTHCMGQGWANALKQFLAAQGITNVAVSMD
jgi:hypothetical protein